MEGLLALIIREWILFSKIIDKGNKIVFTNKIMSPNFHPKQNFSSPTRFVQAQQPSTFVKHMIIFGDDRIS